MRFQAAYIQQNASKGIMKRLFWLCGSLLMLTCFAPAQRLPEIASPENYKLTFTPDFDKGKFAGEETIQLRVLKSTSAIVLNSAEIEFNEVTITAGGSTQTAKVTLDKEKEMVTLAVDKLLATGPAAVHIKYTGILNDQLRGFYLGKDEQGRKYAVTQFEATDARRAFPSFDEPAYKATFDVTVVAGKDLAVISNSKQASDVPGPAADQHTVRFATTPKMSSYLLAIAVGNFEYVEGSANGIPIRVWTMPGKKELGHFALEAAQQVMQYYNRYFTIKYPYDKLDMIGLPDFSAGAMENTGFITYREVLLLLDDKHASVDAKKYVAIVIAHEMAHQWFGDLVTMQWWDDIWLNEGFATWMESKPVQAWKPEWHFDLDDVQDTTESLNADSLANTRPIRQPAETPAEIVELFDGIAYGKAAAVLRMLESYLGPETFRAGVNAYLKKHSYANATATDFWNTQAQVSHKPVDKIMSTFVEQPGAPVVAVNSQCSGVSGAATLEQQRFFYDRQKFNEGSNELWQIPICLKEEPANGKSSQQCQLLIGKQGKAAVHNCSSGIYANAGATGYYRSSYTPEILQALSAVLETELTPGERIMLLSDVWASVRVGRNKIGDYLALANGLRPDRERAVLAQLTRQLDYIGDHLVDEADRQSYESWVKALLKPAAQSVAWDPKAGESDEQKTLRRQLLLTLGRTARDPEAQAVARKFADQALQNPASVGSELASAALRVAAFDGDEALYDRVMERLKNTKTPQEFYVFQSALSFFSDPKLLQRTLDYAISPAVRSQDSLGVIDSVMRNPAGTKLAWDFVRAHWDQLAKMGGGFAGAEVVEATSSFCDGGLRDEMKDFFSTHNVPAAQRTLKQSVEQINYCVDLKSQQGPQLASWLGQHATSSAGE